MKHKTVGIIGGMGAIATVDLFQKIVSLTDAKKDQDHIHVLIDNNTKIPDRTAFLLSNNKNDSPKDYLIESAGRLESYGAKILSIACNTSHYFFPDVQSAVNIPVVNMIEETALDAADKKLKCVGVLGTEGFIRFVDYKSFYSQYGIETICPTDEEQKYVSDLIYNGIKSQNYAIDTSNFLAVLKRMSDAGVEAFALSCTELPIAFSHFQINYPFIDSSIALAKKIIVEAGGKIKPVNNTRDLPLSSNYIKCD